MVLTDAVHDVKYDFRITTVTWYKPLTPFSDVLLSRNADKFTLACGRLLF
jgi:hypothetical protein